MPPAKQQEFMEKYFKLHSDIKQELAAVQKAQAEAVPQEVILPMKTDLGKKIELYRRLTDLLGQKKFSPSTGTVPAPPSQPPAPGVATTAPVSDSNPPNPVPPAPGLAQPSLPSTTGAEPQNPSVPNPTAPPKETYPTEVVAQIHRLMQQQNQQPLTQSGIFPQISHPFPPSSACSSHHAITRIK